MQIILKNFFHFFHDRYFERVNEEKVTVAGCSTGSKEFLRREVDKNVANKKHRNTPRIHNNKYT